VLSDGNYVYLGERSVTGLIPLRPLESIHVQFPKLDVAGSNPVSRSIKSIA
jgi:hypothetical protein